MPTSQLGDEDFLKLYARNRALGKIMHETRFGEVDAISFDLRHSKINPDEWIMDHLAGDDGREPTRTETLPFIWFPWYGQFDPERLKAEVVKECRESNEYDRNRPPTLREVFGNVTDAEYRSYLKQERKPKPLGKKWVNEEIAKRTPDAIVKSGDCIRVHKVIMYIHDDDQFIPIQDRANIHVFVKVTDTTGLCRLLDAPIIMRGATELTYRRGNMKIYSILGRVRRYYKLERLSYLSAEGILNNPSRYGADEALFRSVKISEYYMPRIWKLKRSENHRLRRIGQNYLEALDDACMLGYSWAKSEHEASMRPLAEIGLKSVSRAHIGGKKSGESRRKEADETWKPHALRLAQSARNKNRCLSREKLTEQIRETWRLSIKIPARSTLTGFLVEMERDGKLERKQRRESLSNEVRTKV